jgi:signal peptidase I
MMSFMSSSGVGVLLELVDEARRKARHLGHAVRHPVHDLLAEVGGARQLEEASPKTTAAADARCVTKVRMADVEPVFRAARAPERGEREAGNGRRPPPVRPLMGPTTIVNSERFKGLRRDGVFVLAMAATLFAARASLADHYVVPTGSMEPTVAVGDHVCVNKLAYGLRVPDSEVYVLPASGPARGDVVVLDSPTDGEVLLKRVVAVPGDRVAVTDGRLTIDGVAIPTVAAEGTPGTAGEAPGGDALLEQLGRHLHRVSLDFGGGPDLPRTVIPVGRYLVLGDNRGNSRDGRYFGLVSRGAILGRAEAVCIHDGRPVWRGL